MAVAPRATRYACSPGLGTKFYAVMCSLLLLILTKKPYVWLPARLGLAQCFAGLCALLSCFFLTNYAHVCMLARLGLAHFYALCVLLHLIVMNAVIHLSLYCTRTVHVVGVSVVWLAPPLVSGLCHRANETVGDVGWGSEQRCK